MLNQTEKRTLKTFATSNIGMLRNNLKTGEGRGAEANEEITVRCWTISACVGSI